MFQTREAERLRKGIDYLEHFLGSGAAYISIYIYIYIYTDLDIDIYIYRWTDR